MYVKICKYICILAYNLFYDALTWNVSLYSMLLLENVNVRGFLDHLRNVYELDGRVNAMIINNPGRADIFPENVTQKGAVM